ncbi:helix-turn-helix transcriptional regulator [Ferrimonas lipolytica]|uniref:Helix-turn-helix transcriptional regulator n=1 Tax=Ferrimonas lipolytica TaxID=2724191 RepID=A0A6H1UHC7_9GAMM|nr:helix-turn-helix transcriptional regulator [Ferrimonas lipolytica]QIZ78010.1 helix-turn-helix transcriptional regulator [Ferrimonas lipolytica]
MTNDSLFLNARQVADYLDLNEKKVYAMANERQLPGTKVTGKWLFPKALIDRWIIDSCHGGTLSDRLIIGGSDDPLLHHVVRRVSQRIGRSGLINYSPSDTRSGLTHLSNGYTDVCCIHWSESHERDVRHPALLKHHNVHKQWVLVHGANRDFGLLMRNEHHHLGQDLQEAVSLRYRWVPRQLGSGSRHQMDNFLTSQGLTASDLNLQPEALSEHELAATIARGEADFGIGCQGIAGEFGLAFLPLGTESFDLVMPQGVFFRQHLQALFTSLQSPDTNIHANMLGGYDLSDCGKIIWSAS